MLRAVIHKGSNPGHLVIAGMLMLMATVALPVQISGMMVPFPG